MINGLGLEYPGLFAVHRPKWAAIVLFSSLLASVLALPSIRFDDDIQRVFSSQSVYSQDYSALIEDLGNKPTDVVVLVESKKPFTAREFTQMRDLALEMELSDTVISVFSPFSARFSRSHPNYPGEPVFPVDIEPGNIAERLAAYRDADLKLRPMIAADNRSAIIAASVDANGKSMDMRNVLAEFRRMTATFGGADLHYTVNGESAIAFEIVDAIQFDLVTLNLLGAVVAFVMALIIFGSVGTALVAVIPAFLGTLTALSLFAYLGYPITVLNNVIPVLVLVLGLADGVHLTMHFKRAAHSGQVQDRIVRTLKEVGPACALTALTTAIAFMAIAVSDNDQLFEFAILGAIGIMISYIVVIMAFALIASFYGRFEKAGGRQWDWLKVPEFVSRWVFSRDRVIIAIALFVSAVCVWGFSRTEAWFPLYQNLPETSEIRRSSQKIEDQFGGYFRIWSELDISDVNGAETEQGWKRLIAFTESIQAAAPDYTTISLVTVARWLGTPDRAPTHEELSDLSEDLKAQLISPDGMTARVITFVPEPMRNRHTRDTHDRIEQAAKSAGAVRIAGFPVILRHEAISVIEQLGIGLVAACLIAVIVVAVAFRWPALAVVLIIPNLLPLLLTASALHVLNNGQVNPTAVLALTIAFGIAVDDSIHFTNRYWLERERGKALDAALRVAINQTGRVMIATTILISTGLLVTTISAFSTVRLFGAMLILTFVVALVADLLLLPALLRQKWFRR